MRTRPALILLLVVAIVLYGSLYPFVFHPARGGFLAALAESLRTPPGRDDLLANFLLYLPLGFLVPMVSGGRRIGPAGRVGIAILAGAVLAAAMEWLQLFDARRVTSAWDILSDTLGAAAGAVASVAIGAMAERRPRLRDGDPLAAMLLCSWVGARLAPFVPGLEGGALRDHLRPLLAGLVVAPLDLLRHAGSWLAAGALLAAAAAPRRPALALFATFAAVEAARLLVAGLRITWAELIGGIAGSALYAATGGRPWLVVAVLAPILLGEGLAPWRLAARAATFHWVPFYGFLHGSLEIAILALLEKFFLYGTLVWALLRAGWSLGLATGVVATALLAIEIAQLYLPGRLPEVTDPLIALIAGLLAACLPARVIARPPPSDRRGDRRAPAGP